MVSVFSKTLVCWAGSGAACWMLSAEGSSVSRVLWRAVVSLQYQCYCEQQCISQRRSVNLFWLLSLQVAPPKCHYEQYSAHVLATSDWRLSAANGEISSIAGMSWCETLNHGAAFWSSWVAGVLEARHLVSSFPGVVWALHALFELVHLGYKSNLYIGLLKLNWWGLYSLKRMCIEQRVELMAGCWVVGLLVSRVLWRAVVTQYQCCCERQCNSQCRRVNLYWLLLSQKVLAQDLLEELGDRRKFLISRFLQTQFYQSCQKF